jgi:hypothetical protein
MRWPSLERHPSALLLLVQLSSLVVYPLLDERIVGRVLFGAVGLVVLLLAVWVVNRSPAANWVAWLLAVPAIVLTVLATITGNWTLLQWSALLEAVLYFYTAGALILYMMNDHRVTADELFAAGATFTLLAWGFAYAFLVCQAWYPGSFTGVVNPSEPRTWMELLFLSFTNLSATGLSDILPLSSPARVLVMLEQFAGVGYIATVVSRLIGLTIVTERRRAREPRADDTDARD